MRYGRRVPNRIFGLNYSHKLTNKLIYAFTPGMTNGYILEYRHNIKTVPQDSDSTHFYGAGVLGQAGKGLNHEFANNRYTKQRLPPIAAYNMTDNQNFQFAALIDVKSWPTTGGQVVFAGKEVFEDRGYLFHSGGSFEDIVGLRLNASGGHTNLTVDRATMGTGLMLLCVAVFQGNGFLFKINSSGLTNFIEGDPVSMDLPTADIQIDHRNNTNTDGTGGVDVYGVWHWNSAMSLSDMFDLWNNPWAMFKTEVPTFGKAPIIIQTASGAGGLGSSGTVTGFVKLPKFTVKIG